MLRSVHHNQRTISIIFQRVHFYIYTTHTHTYTMCRDTKHMCASNWIRLKHFSFNRHRLHFYPITADTNNCGIMKNNQRTKCHLSINIVDMVFFWFSSFSTDDTFLVLPASRWPSINCILLFDFDDRPFLWAFNFVAVWHNPLSTWWCLIARLENYSSSRWPFFSMNTKSCNLVGLIAEQNIISFLNWWDEIRFQNYRYSSGIDRHSGQFVFYRSNETQAEKKK